MPDSVKLKKSLFGIKKSSVQEYISGVSQNIDDKLFLKDNEIKKLKKTIETLTGQNEELNKQIEGFKAEKDKLAQMFINAQETAEKIINEAKSKADGIISDAENKSLEEKDKAERIIADANENVKLAKEQAEAEQLRILREYEKEIEEKKAVVEKCKLEINSLQSKIKLTLKNFDDILSDIIK